MVQLPQVVQPPVAQEGCKVVRKALPAARTAQHQAAKRLSQACNLARRLRDVRHPLNALPKRHRSTGLVLLALRRVQWAAIEALQDNQTMAV